MPGLERPRDRMQMPRIGRMSIFFTAHPEHAVQAFDVGAVDYVLKPVEERLRAAVKRAAARRREARRGETAQTIANVLDSVRRSAASRGCRSGRSSE